MAPRVNSVILARLALPLTVQTEARVAGHRDDARVRAAFGSACAVHPRARARVRPWRGGDTTLEWEIDDVPQLDALEVLDVVDDAAHRRRTSAPL